MKNTKNSEEQVKILVFDLFCCCLNGVCLFVGRFQKGFYEVGSVQVQTGQIQKCTSSDSTNSEVYKVNFESKSVVSTRNQQFRLEIRGFYSGLDSKLEGLDSKSAVLTGAG